MCLVLMYYVGLGWAWIEKRKVKRPAETGDDHSAKSSSNEMAASNKVQ